MKKILSLLLGFVVLTNIQASAMSIEVQPTMFSRSNAQDRVWVGSFQLVWNDFMDKVVHNPIRFREGTPIIVHELNMQSFTENDLSEKSYYKTICKVTKNTKKQINKALKKKFKETSDLIDKLDLSPRNDKFIVYSMLKKDFEFLKAFDKLGTSSFGDAVPAEYFGISRASDKSLGSVVTVLFYNGPDDYAVKLATTGADEVILYKNTANKAFAYLYADMLKKEQAYDGGKYFRATDELKVPNITFDAEVSYDELAKRRIMGTNLLIDQAMQTVKFDMNNKGVKLKSEAAMTVMTMSLQPEDLIPRLFYFDDTFVLFLKEKNKQKPYFALRVNDITNYQKK
ncbi:hypothetical protein IJD34_08605 [bacterium]|nr:hypothetical protein [bacterium]